MCPPPLSRSPREPCAATRSKALLHSSDSFRPFLHCLRLFGFGSRGHGSGEALRSFLKRFHDTTLKGEHDLLLLPVESLKASRDLSSLRTSSSSVPAGASPVNASGVLPSCLVLCAARHISGCQRRSRSTHHHHHRHHHLHRHHENFSRSSVPTKGSRKVVVSCKRRLGLA